MVTHPVRIGTAFPIFIITGGGDADLLAGHVIVIGKHGLFADVAIDLLRTDVLGALPAHLPGAFHVFGEHQQAIVTGLVQGLSHSLDHPVMKSGISGAGCLVGQPHGAHFLGFAHDILRGKRHQAACPQQEDRQQQNKGDSSLSHSFRYVPIGSPDSVFKPW